MRRHTPFWSSLVRMTGRAVVLTVCLSGLSAKAQITGNNWGTVAAPVHSSTQPGYPGAERFTGPQQFGDDDYHGVLPNGRIIRPAGHSVQIGMSPLGARLSPDGRFLIISNDDDDDASLGSQSHETIVGGYSLSVIDAQTMTVVSQVSTAGRFFIGLQVMGSGPYTVWASGGGDNSVKRFTVSASGMISAAGSVAIRPITPSQSGYVSHYRPGAQFTTADEAGNRPPVPSGFDRTAGAASTFPAGSALSPDGNFLYVACNGDNSLGARPSNRERAPSSALRAERFYVIIKNSAGGAGPTRSVFALLRHAPSRDRHLIGHRREADTGCRRGDPAGRPARSSRRSRKIWTSRR